MMPQLEFNFEDSTMKTIPALYITQTDDAILLDYKGKQKWIPKDFVTLNTQGIKDLRFNDLICGMRYSFHIEYFTRFYNV